jgi:UPF0288 family protein (methanogenesis marker protein 3)
MRKWVRELERYSTEYSQQLLDGTSSCRHRSAEATNDKRFMAKCEECRRMRMHWTTERCISCQCKIRRNKKMVEMS